MPRPVLYAAPPPVVRYGYAPGARFVYEDERTRRIRQAEEAGYLVVRARSVEFPDGRRLRTYRPLDDGDED